MKASLLGVQYQGFFEKSYMSRLCCIEGDGFVKEIFFPKELDDRGAVYVVNSILKIMDETEKIALNFSQLNFVKPFGVMLTAKCLRYVTRVKGYNPFVPKDFDDFLTKHRPSVSYLNYFNFFVYVGLEEYSDEGAYGPGKTYIPITEINSMDLERYGETVLQENILRHSTCISQLLFDDNDESEVEMVSYFFREMIRNVFEHAESSVCHIMAQKWQDKIIEIVISDDGIGILESMRKKYDIKDNITAIREALKPAISSIHYEDSHSDDKWENSGFGLYVVSEMGREMYGFSIFSKSDMVSRSRSTEQMFRLPMDGTIIKVSFDISDAEYFFNKLHRIVGQGEKLAELELGKVVRASRASKTIFSF